MSVFENIIEACDLPKDTMLGAMLITFIGQNELLVENYKSITEFTDTELKITGTKSRVHISGRELMICNYDGVEMKIKGIIDELKFY
ncbi:MAG: YabP/YqfC family sporulation protein [Eubacterium sp.]